MEIQSATECLYALLTQLGLDPRRASKGVQGAERALMEFCPKPSSVDRPRFENDHLTVTATRMGPGAMELCAIRSQGGSRYSIFASWDPRAGLLLQKYQAVVPEDAIRARKRSFMLTGTYEPTDLGIWQLSEVSAVRNYPPPSTGLRFSMERGTLREFSGFGHVTGEVITDLSSVEGQVRVEIPNLLLGTRGGGREKLVATTLELPEVLSLSGQGRAQKLAAAFAEAAEHLKLTPFVTWGPERLAVLSVLAIVLGGLFVLASSPQSA